jgi:hypothetical protein
MNACGTNLDKLGAPKVKLGHHQEGNTMMYQEKEKMLLFLTLVLICVIKY